LLNFNGSRVKTQIQLNWQTIQEINVGDYFIERSLDGANFKGIGVVHARGNSSVVQAYSYGDSDAATFNNNTLFYRLKITDKDGRYSYSKIISLQPDNKNKALVIYPNPSTASAILQFTATAAKKYTVAVSAADGKVLNQVIVAASPGINRVVLDVHQLPAATYLVTIIGDNDGKTVKLVKQ
jgi:hypothetical protein